MQNLQLPKGLPSNGELIVLGLMSGTSLDGLDLALCRFSWNNKMGFDVLSATTIPYEAHWRHRLQNAPGLNALEMSELDVELGQWMATQAHSFLNGNKELRPQLIASHGHTIFHQPHKGYTLQIGSGAVLAAKTNIPVVCDFRSQDVALGGQGAPLVPIGDRDLFGEFDACVNLGGFANVSMEVNGKRIAWDICPVNVILNKWAEELGVPFDDEGINALQGEVNEDLLEALDQIPFYQKSSPKSLGVEWVSDQMVPILRSDSKLSTRDKMRTYVEHIAIQIGSSLDRTDGRVLFTGGGVWNTFLMDRIQKNARCKVIIPQKDIVEFKEAIVFAYLGLLRWYGAPNVLKSVTGSSKDHVAGSFYL